MKDYTHNSWEEDLAEIMKHPRFARHFAQGLLHRTLGHPVKVQKVTGSASPGLFLVAEEPVFFENQSVKSRRIRILLQNPASCPHPTYASQAAQGRSITLYYDCVEAPAILLDKGITDIRLVVDQELKEYICRFKNAMECV